jgi:hypothetical protein
MARRAFCGCLGKGAPCCLVGLRSLFPGYPGARQIILAEIDRVQTSCGFGVPLMEYTGERDALVKYAETTGEAGLARYRQEKNVRSMDGLPAPLAAVN